MKDTFSKIWLAILDLCIYLFGTLFWKLWSIQTNECIEIVQVHRRNITSKNRYLSKNFKISHFFNTKVQTIQIIMNLICMILNLATLNQSCQSTRSKPFQVEIISTSEEFDLVEITSTLRWIANSDPNPTQDALDVRYFTEQFISYLWGCVCLKKNAILLCLTWRHQNFFCFLADSFYSTFKKMKDRCVTAVSRLTKKSAVSPLDGEWFNCQNQVWLILYFYRYYLSKVRNL